MYIKNNTIFPLSCAPSHSLLWLLPSEKIYLLKNWHSKLKKNIFANLLSGRESSERDTLFLLFAMFLSYIAKINIFPIGTECFLSSCCSTIHKRNSLDWTKKKLWECRWLYSAHNSLTIYCNLWCTKFFTKNILRVLGILSRNIFYQNFIVYWEIFLVTRLASKISF